MSRQQTPEEDFDVQQELLTYCEENEITFPFQDLPFEWVDAIFVPQSPPPSLNDAFATVPLAFDEECFEEDMGLDDYLAQVVSPGDDNGVLVIRTLPTADLQFLTPFQHGDAFRRYGPINLEKCALFLPTEPLKGESGMEISHDRSDLEQANTKDSRLAVTQDDAEFLKSIIAGHTRPTQTDFVLPKPPRKDLILSPPLLPYESDFIDFAPPSLPAVDPFNTQLSSSQEFWDRFPSLSPQYMDNLVQAPSEPSPAKVATKESDLVSNLRVELPLTPDSTKKTTQQSDQPTLKSMNSLISPPTIPRSPDSPDTSPSKFLRTLETQLFNENYSGASSLRLSLPQLPPPSPRTNRLPTSLMGLYLAEDSLRCDVIPQSALDMLNSEMKWHPFAKTLKAFDTWSEDVEGDWEEFVDYLNVSRDDDTPRGSRTYHCEEEDELRPIGPLEPTAREEDTEEFLAIIEEVRKRKSFAPNFTDGERGKRLKFSQKSRIVEYMTSQRGQSVDLSDDDAPGDVRILENTRNDEVYAAPVPVFQVDQDPVAPPNEIDPSAAVSAIILSTTILEHHYLTTFLREKLVNTTFFERDLTIVPEGAEDGDIILSANRCILFSTVAQVTQTLPSSISERILGVAAKHRQVEILVICTGPAKGKDVAPFIGWTEKVGNVRVVFANGEEAVKRWTLWLCLWRELDRSSFKEHLREDESEEELFLRRAFNVYNSQVILGRIPLSDFLDLSHEMRLERFHDVSSERCLRLL